LETGDVQAAIDNYVSNYNIVTDQIVNEVIKLEYLIPKALELLPDGECEVEISTPDFIGFIDRLCPTFVDEDGVQHWDLYDYKYTKNGERYKTSKQLHIYKYYFELTHPNNVIDHLYYLIIGKTAIRQKKTETIQQFRNRLLETLETLPIEIMEVTYSISSISQFQECCQHLNSVEEYPENPTRLCDWCDYQPYCQRGEDWMLLDK
jgi:hypothetical protein